MALTPAWFGWLAARLREESIAPVVFNLEGGYNPDNCVVATGATIRGISGDQSSRSFLDEMGLQSSADSPGGAGGAERTVTTRGTTIVLPEGETLGFVESFEEARAAQTSAKRQLDDGLEVTW